MAKFENGILGGFNGKVGNVVGSSWKGITYMRAKSTRSNKKASEKQLMQRSKFLFATNFIQPLHPIIQIGFRKMEVHQSAKNAAMSELLNYAIEGEYPNYGVNFRNLRLSKGSLDIPQNCTVALQDGRIAFAWTMDSNSEDTTELDKRLQSLSEDKMILVALANGFAPRYTLHNYTRQDLSGDLGLPDAPSGTEVHCYLTCASNSSNRTVSNTVYAGTVTVP